MKLKEERKFDLYFWNKFYLLFNSHKTQQYCISLINQFL